MNHDASISQTNPAPIYLDYNATTPVDPRVAEAMTPFLSGFHGNPSSSHQFGKEARAAVEKARGQVAAFLGADPQEIIFTSGGTEANNHAIIGAARSGGKTRRHLVTSAVEHPAVTEVFRHLESQGFTTTLVPVDGFGRVDPHEMIAALTPETALVTLMHANNEVGTLQPVAEVAAAAKKLGILTHSDCAQSLGKIPVSCHRLGVDMISLAGHKLYAPKGIGVLYMRRGTEVPNLLHGAGHESGRRPGTENVLEIVGLGMACALAGEDLAEETKMLAKMRDRLQAGLLEKLDGAKVHGHPQDRLPNTLSIGFSGTTAQDIMAAMPMIAVSAGAACHGHGAELSSVLQAMGADPRFGRGTLRLSLGRMTTDQEIDQALPIIVAAVTKARTKA